MHGGAGNHAFLARRVPPGFELGLHQGNQPPLVAQHLPERRENLQYGDEGYVHYAQRWGIGKHFPRQRPRVGLFHLNHLRVVAQPGIQLSRAHIHGVDPARARLEQYIRKAAGGRAHVDGRQAHGRNAEALQRALQFESAPAHIGAAFAPDAHFIVRAHLLRGLFEGRFAHIDQTCGDQRLRALPARSQSPGAQSHIRPLQSVFLHLTHPRFG